MGSRLLLRRRLLRPSLLIGPGAPLAIFPARDSGRALTEKDGFLGRCHEAGRGISPFGLPARDHLARAGTERTVDAADVEAL